jgi:hypothetical protein
MYNPASVAGQKAGVAESETAAGVVPGGRSKSSGIAAR